MDERQGVVVSQKVKSKIKISALIALICFCYELGFSKTEKLDDDELAQEAILPVFDEKIAVKGRRINHAKKLEIGLFGGNVLSETIYTPMTMGLSAAYHFDNTNGFYGLISFYPDSLSDNGTELKEDGVIPVGGGPGKRFDATRAPHKQFLIAGHYQYTAYYGKVSLTKDAVMNLSLYGLLGGGAYIMRGDIAPAFNFGVGQRFYFTKNLAFRLDLLMSAFYGVDITSTATQGGACDPLNPGDSLCNSGPAPDVDASAFDKKLLFDTQINLGITLLL